MKKTLCALLAALLMLTAAALAETTAEWIAPEPGEAVTAEKDLGVLIDGVFYPVYQPVEPLLDALGEPEETVVSPSCVFEGEDCEYDYAFGSLYTSPIEGGNVWYEFYITGEGMTTTRGLAVGDTVERMLELYGENYFSEGEDMYTYSLSGDPEDLASPCLIIETKEGVVLTIDIYYPTNV